MDENEKPKKAAPMSDVQWDEVQCHQKAKARGDMTFTLVGQDRTSPSTICWWILQNIETCPADKLRNALERAIQMRSLPTRKSPD
jgi:hypothetical protein